MPCFKGIAVSVHAEGAPLPEYSVQTQSRVDRVNTYIPVPPAKVPKDSNLRTPEPSRFAISITLLTPGLPVPYSTPKPTPNDPFPGPQVVGSYSPNTQAVNQRGFVKPYIPTTNNDNETIAAYIYFDGRAKEEVATLLRPGEETWVNSRWVQVPDSEGGGLAEREFLFREVGLERWLNGLDLEGSDAAAKLERRRQKFDKRRRRKEVLSDSDDDLTSMKKVKSPDVLRYGPDATSPIESLSDDEELSDDESDDDAPPEAAGQIKVAMFRVLASGEIKRGEYSPQFDAHDDDESSEGGGKDTGNGSDEADVDHTTSFAKPKTLDPKSISTQTVTGIDGPEKPYATFTFFYRGERQLQKMGILESSKQQKPSATASKRRSAGIDFSNLGPLKSGGTVGFSAFRDTDTPAARKNKSRKKSNGALGDMEEDSDEDDDDANIVGKIEDLDEKDHKQLLSPEDARYQGELADGVRQIKLKRAHSAEPLDSSSRKSSSGTPATGTSPPDSAAPFTTTPNLNINNMFSKTLPDDSLVGSPLKKQRGSIYDHDDPEGMKKLLNNATFSAPMEDILGRAEAAQAAQANQTPLATVKTEVMDQEDEL